MGNSAQTRKKRISVGHIEGSRDFINRDAIPYILREAGETVISTDNINNLYIFSKLIGKGSFGKTKEAYLIRNPAQRFAIKCIKSTKSSKNRHYLASELTILRALNHPNIVKLHEAYKNHSNIYLVTELCKGGDLLSRMEAQERFPEYQVARILYQVFSAIKYMHKVGVAHRDLKPDNILFTSTSPNAEVKVVDFGLSQYFAGNLLYHMHSKVGSYAFTAPEVYTNNYTEQCDNWSVGVIMYMMLTGSFPFRNDTIQVMLKEIKMARFSMNSQLFRGVSAEAKDLIQQLLVADPEKRYTATEALDHPFFNLFRYIQIDVDQKLVTRVVKSSKMRRLKFEFLNLLTKGLSDSGEQMYLEHFRYFDKSNNGYIDTEDFLTSLKELGNKYSYHQMKPIIENLNLGDYRKTVSYNEFVIAALDRETITKKIANEIFEFFDWKQKGLVDAETMKKGFTKVGVFFEDGELAQMINETNPIAPGFLNFVEFFNLLKSE